VLFLIFLCQWSYLTVLFFFSKMSLLTAAQLHDKISFSYYSVSVINCVMIFLIFSFCTEIILLTIFVLKCMIIFLAGQFQFTYSTHESEGVCFYRRWFVCLWKFENLRWRRPSSLKIENWHITIVVWAISTKFDSDAVRLSWPFRSSKI